MPDQPLLRLREQGRRGWDASTPRKPEQWDTSTGLLTNRHSFFRHLLILRSNSPVKRRLVSLQRDAGRTTRGADSRPIDHPAEVRAKTAIRSRRSPSGRVRWHLPGGPHLDGKRCECQSTKYRWRAEQSGHHLVRFIFSDCTYAKDRDISLQIVTTKAATHFYSEDEVERAYRDNRPALSASNDGDDQEMTDTIDGLDTIPVWTDEDEWSVRAG